MFVFDSRLCVVMGVCLIWFMCVCCCVCVWFMLHICLICVWFCLCLIFVWLVFVLQSQCTGAGGSEAIEANSRLNRLKGNNEIKIETSEAIEGGAGNEAD